MATKEKRLKRKARPAVSSVVEHLKIWRKTNGLSQKQAVLVMEHHGLDLPLSVLQKYEGSFRLPGRFTAQVLEQFLNAHPTITNPPVVGKWKNVLPAEKVAEIMRLRKSGATLASIATQFEISESSVSRICSGERRAKS